MGRRYKNLYLFDPITTNRMPTTIAYLRELIGIRHDCLLIYMYRSTVLPKINCFLCSEYTTKDDLKMMMNKYHSAETKNEIWKYTDDTKKYQVSNLGRVRKINKTTEPYFIIPYLNERSKGLFRVKLSYKNVYKECMLHQIVAELFLENDDPINNTHIIHKNGIKTDNRACNLLYVTKNRATSLGGKTTFERREAKEIIRRELGTGKEIGRYYTLKEAEQDTGIRYQNIYDCLTGKRPTMGSSTWEYATE